MTETQIPFDSLTPNPRNPRTPWKEEQLEPFRESLRRFGDLGGIVRNLTTGQLVGGHKRVEVFRTTTAPTIVKTDQAEDGQGTVAIGYVIVDGTRFAYREVRWPAEVEAAANLAANRWGAEWAWQMVSETLQGISDPALLPLTGFPAHELETLLAADWMPATRETLPDDSGQAHLVRLSDEQHALLQQVKDRLATRFDNAITDPMAIAFLCKEFLHAA
jgi:hypothetical protein